MTPKSRKVKKNLIGDLNSTLIHSFVGLTFTYIHCGKLLLAHPIIWRKFAYEIVLVSFYVLLQESTPEEKENQPKLIVLYILMYFCHFRQKKNIYIYKHQSFFSSQRRLGFVCCLWPAKMIFISVCLLLLHIRKRGTWY